MRDGLRQIWLLASTAIRVSPGRAALCLMETIGQAALVLSALWLKMLVDAAVARDRTMITFAVVAIVMSTGTAMLLRLVGSHSRIAITERVGFEFDRQIAELTARIPSLAHQENPEYHDHLQVLRERRNALGQALSFILNVANTLAFTLATAVIAVTADPRLLILVAVGATSIIGARFRNRWSKIGENASAEPARLSQHFSSLVSDANAGMELRVFGLRDEIRRRLRDSVRAWRAPLNSAEAKSALLSFAETVLFMLVAGAVLTWMVIDATRGLVSPGTVVLAVALLGQLQSAASSTTWIAARASEAIRTADRLLWLRDYADRVAREQYAGKAAPPGRASTRYHAARGVLQI